MMIKIFFLFKMFFILYSCGYAGQEVAFSKREDFTRCSISNGAILFFKEGYHGIVFTGKQWEPDEDCDLYIDFKEKNPSRDVTLNYLYQNYKVVVNPDVRHNDYRTGGFVSGQEKIKVRVHRKNYLSSDNPDLGSFSIDFFIYPVMIEKEHVLIRKGIYYDDQFYGLRVFLIDKKIKISLENMFTDDAGKTYSRELIGAASVSLKEWQHIGIKYNRANRKLSLYINGGLDTENLTDSEQVSEVVRFHRKDGSDLELFETFKGYVAQFRIMKTAQADYQGMIDPLPDRMQVVSPVLDLKYPHSMIHSFVFRIRHLEEAQALLMLKKGNTKEEMLRAGWQEASLDEKKEMLHVRENIKARFLQWKLMINRNRASKKIPHLASIRLRYEENPPPLPPGSVKVEKADGDALKISWEKNYEEEVQGYVVYWGIEPKEYENKVDIGFKNSYIMPSLPKGKTYYFAVKAYSGREPYHMSAFSSEARIYLK